MRCKRPAQRTTLAQRQSRPIPKEGGSLTILQTQHRGETIFSIEHILGTDARTTTYYRCNGWEICKTSVTIAGLTSCLGDFPNELTARKMIYPEITVK